MEFVKRITSTDAHSGGEPIRMLTGGLPLVKGRTMDEKCDFFQQYCDSIRQHLMFEPRGHHGMCGCVVADAVSEDADFSVLFTHHNGLWRMSGHGIIAVVTALLETGQLDGTRTGGRFLIDTPVGQIRVVATISGSKVTSVSFQNVPSFRIESTSSVVLDGKEVAVDIAYGGIVHAFVAAEQLGLHIQIPHLSRLQAIQKEVTKALNDGSAVQDAVSIGGSGVEAVTFVEQPSAVDGNIRTVTIFGNQQIDRSPSGTALSAWLAHRYAAGDIKIGQSIVFESIVSSTITGQVKREVKVGERKAVIPEITGNAFVTGFHNFVVDPSDPLQNGFLLR